MKLFFHRLKHWEYWPAYLLYAPTALLWLYYMVKFRSFRFYDHANPGIAHGGFYGDRKSDIYPLLPKGTYPETVLIKAHELEKAGQLIRHSSLKFPLIIKPDIGLRGQNVAQISDLEALLEAGSKMNQDFLVQELVQYPHEIGLFYVRIPGAPSGQITGLTIKAMLTVQGNGKSTLKQLIQQNPRFAMQVNQLKKRYDLNEVLAEGEERCLVPFGNHNRGTTFYDGRNQLTIALTSTWTKILDQVEGFYYGRLDIRFASWEALEAGHSFSIIEVNGAKSEPTHIYDPSHSFWFGQKEILRHQRLMAQVIRGILQQDSMQSGVKRGFTLSR